MAEKPQVEEADETLAPTAKPKAAKKDVNAMEGLYYGEQEKSFEQSSYYPGSMQKPHNPDALVQKDFTYAVYEDMLNDDQVNVALQLKKDLVVGSGWHISHSDETVKKELEAILTNDIERSMSDILQDMIQAYEFGFSISEKIFKTLDDGRLALKDIKPRHPSTWLLHTDEHGNMIRYEQRGTRTSIDIDPKSIIHYVNNPKFQNPYGRSDLASAYQAYMTKRHVTRFYAIFLENAAGPKPIAKYDRRAPPGVVDDIFNAIKKLQTKSALVIPKDFEMEYLETTNSGDAYVKGINLFNMFIGRALFIPDLVGFSGGETGGGSFSLGKEQIGLFYKHIFRRREVLEQIFDKHVIRPLCVYNYGLMEDYPKFKFNPLSDEDANKNAELWIKGVQGIGYEPTLEEVNHFRTLVKFPEADEELTMKGAGVENEGDSNGDNVGEMGGEEDKGEEGREEEENSKPPEKQFSMKTYGGPGSGPQGGSGGSSKDGEDLGQGPAAIEASVKAEVAGMGFKEKSELLDKAKIDVEAKANESKAAVRKAKAARTRADNKPSPENDEKANVAIRAANKAGAALNDAMDRRSALVKNLSLKEYALALSTLPGDYKKKVNFKLADQLLKTSVSKIKTEAEPIIEDIFEDLYAQLQKKKIIQNQDLEKAETIQLKYLSRLQMVFRKHFRRLHDEGMQMAKTEVRKSDFAGALPNDVFLDFLEQETFKYVGDWSYEITKKTKNALVSAIKDGKSLSSVISVLDDEGKALSDVSLERYSRTKTTEVFNRGRREYFDSTGVVAAYQYSAILDDVTSDICGNLHGLTFDKEDAPTPPLHFNCRSLLIPITRFESYETDKVTNGGQNVDKFLEQNVTDKGFSVFSKDAPALEQEPEVKTGPLIK